MIDANSITLLETTLRDGSYVIDFQFTARDTELLSRSLAEAGVQLIEVGHGLGINASPLKGQAAADDVDYVAAARRGAPEAMIGMFCIPGIAELDHLRACADAGLQFVRVGVNVDEFQVSEPFIAEARKLGLFVCTNFMKSYAMAPEAFAEMARESEGFGSQLVYLVDSAGGMLPADVTRYVEALRHAVTVPIGFHGHNNLHLGVANSLAALDAGSKLVDSTLLGMGRSSGNPPTEIMVPLLQRCYDACQEMDGMALLETAERVISPLVKNRWEDTVKTALGLAQVHSQYVGTIRKTAEEKDRNLFSLISEVGQRDRLNLPVTVLEESVAAAASEEDIRELIGDISLLEPLEETFGLDDLLRAQTKTNLPFTLRVEPNVKQKANYTDTAIRLSCEPAFALELITAAPKHISRIDISGDLQAFDSDTLNRLRDAVDDYS